MQLVINIPFQKYLIITTFIALLFKVGFNIAMMIMGDSMDGLEAALLTARHFIDTAMWFMIALWFLYIYLYSVDVVSKRGMHITTNFTIAIAMVKSLTSIIFVIYYIKPVLGWTIFFSIVEIIFWLGLFIYMAYLWMCSYNQYMQLKKHNNKVSKKYYTLEDEAQRVLNQ